MTRAAAIARGVLIAGFAWGTLTHAIDWWRFGWWPYRFGPPLANAFWNALVLLDAVTVALLMRHIARGGVAMAAAVMIADVTANIYAWQVLGFERFAISVAFQAAFLGYVLGTAPLLWREQGAKDRCDRSNR
ncbi:hypothetical protein KZ810_05750 [Sphingomonas sp. RHCKR47]|uniref:hypothetical protein n=1 Tax=Sphingomonas citricola TaxID=2862498 RepID=UPI001CA51BF8|nr:hypothetical protein [Sphingomonas citricola]MBW6522995.1 hypothetical protein [Sphingomonas citricola]